MVTDDKKRVELEALIKLAEERPEELVRISEERYRRQIAEVADRFCEGFEQNPHILLAGPSSSGKTTTSLNLETELMRRGIRTIAVSLDDFFVDRQLAKYLPDGTQDLEDPELVDLAELERCLSELTGQGRCEFPIYDFSVGQRSKTRRPLVFDSRTAVIIEGIHALNPMICKRPFFKGTMKLYISIKTEYYLGGQRILNTREARLMRRIIRDSNFRACPPAATLGMWGNVVAGEERYIRPFRTEADYWIDSLHLYEPMLYKPVLEPMLAPLQGSRVCGEAAGRLLEALEGLPAVAVKGIPADSLMREFLPLGGED